MIGDFFYITLASAFWFSVAFIFYTYAGYPVWIYVRSRLYPVPWHRARMQPSVSIVVAVHNGGDLLAPKIDHLLGLDYPNDCVEIIIVSDGSTDGTNGLLNALSHPRVKSVLLQERQGKAVALNAGIQRASGEIILFVDIRPWLEADAVQLLMSNFADPQVGCAAGELVLCEDGHDAGTKAVGGLYWRFEQWIRLSEAKVDSPLGLYGGFYAIRREVITLFPDGLINDDMFQLLNVIRRGYRVVLDMSARVHDTWPKSSRDEFNRKVRTLAGNFQMLQLAPWVLSDQNRLRFGLISHKMLRLVVPVMLLTSLIASTLLASRYTFYAVAAGAQVGMYILAALGSGRSVPILKRIAGPANAFCMLNFAVVVGLYRFLFARGPLWKIWVMPSAPKP